MKTRIVVSSINELTNIASLCDVSETLGQNDVKITIVDEGNKLIRKKNHDLFSNVEHEFYGPRERGEWFRQRYGSEYRKYSSVIPEHCHAETSFGFLVAYEEEADVVIELDDDVFPVGGLDLVESHLGNLSHHKGVGVSSECKWYNTIQNLILSSSSNAIFPRGHPYSPDTRFEAYTWRDSDDTCVLNMGLWIGHPDLDALTILYHGGLDGRCSIESKGLEREKIVVDEGTYFALCSMNTAFVSDIIPAFYQLYMKNTDIDRFDDIWSGIFIKKIADHLGNKICLGKPSLHHDKRPRDTFKDLRSELEGIIINENLWRIVDSVQLNSKDFFSCYAELIEGLEKNLEKFNKKTHRDEIKFQIDKMRVWLDVINKLR